MRAVRTTAPDHEFNGIPVFGRAALSESDAKELCFWGNDPLEKPGGNLFDNILHKSQFIHIFQRYSHLLHVKPDDCVLELGAGHGWASALVKRSNPTCYVVVSDVAPDALASLSSYEELLGVKVDERLAFPVQQMPFASETFDLVFAFAAFHHFIIGNRYDETVREIVRVLKPGGRLVVLYEPSAPSWIYPRALKRANGNRHLDGVEEDVLQLKRLGQSARRYGASMTVSSHVDFLDRPGPLETVYYLGLRYLPLLRRVLPCTVDVQIERVTGSVYR